ncbi:hypothetical protein DVH24_016475, partial [Malus domestica]
DASDFDRSTPAAHLSTNGPNSDDVLRPCFCLADSAVWNLHKLAANIEGDALNALKTNLADPNNVLQSWDPALYNPCTWLHVTCNSKNRVTVRYGNFLTFLLHPVIANANLSGQLVAQLGVLSKLQYL